MDLEEKVLEAVFTEVGETIDAKVNKLTAKCLSSENNTFSLDCEGNLSVNSITTKTGIGEGLTFNDIYPIGAIYISVADTNPSVLFGGTWEQLKDRFLLGAGDTYANGNMGGWPTHLHTTAGHTLTVAEMPGHSHGTTYSNWTGYKITGTGIIYTNIEGANSVKETTYTGGNQPHYHGDTGITSNMPPYLTVYMWKRVA